MGTGRIRYPTASPSTPHFPADLRARRIRKRGASAPQHRRASDASRTARAGEPLRVVPPPARSRSPARSARGRDRRRPRPGVRRDRGDAQARRVRRRPRTCSGTGTSCTSARGTTGARRRTAARGPCPPRPPPGRPAVRGWRPGRTGDRRRLKKKRGKRPGDGESRGGEAAAVRGSGTPETAIADRRVPERAIARSAPPERGRGARRKALKRARRARRAGAAEGADAPKRGRARRNARALHAPPGRHGGARVRLAVQGGAGIPALKHITQGRSQEEKEAGQAAWDEHKAYMRAKDAARRAGMRNGTRARPTPRTSRAASFLPANAALDPNGDLASHGARWRAGRARVGAASEPGASCELAESSLARRRSPTETSRLRRRREKRRRSVERAEDCLRRRRQSHDHVCDSVVFGHRIGPSSSRTPRRTRLGLQIWWLGGEARERAPPAEKNPDPPRSTSGFRVTGRAGRVTRARLGCWSPPTTRSRTGPLPSRKRRPRRRGARPASRRRRAVPVRTPPEARADRAYAFACSYFQGEVVSVGPTSGTAAACLAVTIAPWRVETNRGAGVRGARGSGGADAFGARERRGALSGAASRRSTRRAWRRGTPTCRRFSSAGPGTSPRRAETNVGVFPNVSRGVGGALAALRAVGSFE